MNYQKEITEFLQHILESNHIPVHYINLPYEENTIINLDMGLREKILQFENIKKYATQFFHSFEKETLYIFTDIFQCNYATLMLPNEKTLFLCGPFMFEKITDKNFEQLFSFLELSEKYREPLFTFYNQVTFLPSKSFFERILLEYYNVLFGTSTQIVYRNMTDLEGYYNIYKNIFRIPEEPFSNIELIEKRYHLENSIMTAIEHGNDILALKLIDKAYKTNALYIKRLEDELRDYKDYIITLNCLCRKSIENAGIHPIYIDSISNYLIIELEKCTNYEQCQFLMEKLIESYCALIKQTTHQSHSPIIKKVLAHIDTDLTADLSLAFFAKRLNVNASYLSTLFSKEMHISLSAYITNCRIQHAQKLLLGTNLPIKSIAEQSGFQDIHYFSRVFKRMTQTTPKAYRNSYIYADKNELAKLKEKK